MAEGTRRVRLAYVVSHPIQYQANLLRRIAADPEIDLTVLFCSDFSARGYKDAGFGVDVTWDVPLLEGYRYRVLPRFRETSEPSPTRPVSRGFLRALLHGSDAGPFDALWVHGYSTVNSLHAMVAAKLLDIPVLLRAESWLADRTRSRRKLLAKTAFFSVLRHLVDAVLPIGTRNAAYWRFYLGENFPAFLMPYAVDNEFFRKRTLAASFRRNELAAELGLHPGQSVILFASKLQERKHADHLLEAFYHLRKRSESPVQLVMIGDGEMRPALERRAKESGIDGVHFLGFRNQSELPRYFDLCSVFVLPSRHEAWGLIVNEAMAAGMPVIVSSDVGCAVDLLRDGNNGYVYPTGDVDALCDALERVLWQPHTPPMGEESRSIIAKWSYAEDLAGLKAALRHVTGIPIGRVGS